MKRRTGPPRPPRTSKRATIAPRTRHTTVPSARPPRDFKPRRPARVVERHRGRRLVAHIIDEDATLLDIIDNLLGKGVVLNADVILALANVDLVDLRLSALLCAADRVMRR